MHNSAIMTRINSLYGSQTSPVVLCIQNSVIISRNTSLYGSHTSPMVFCMKNSDWLATELQVCMCPSTHLLFCEFTTASSWQELTSLSESPYHNCDFVRSKLRLIRTRIASLIMRPGPHLLFCGCTTATLCTRITNLFGSKTTPIVLCMQSSVISTQNY